MSYYYLLVAKKNCSEQAIRALEAVKPLAFTSESEKENLIVLLKGRNIRLESQLQAAGAAFSGYMTVPTSFKPARNCAHAFARFKNGDLGNVGSTMGRRIWYS